MKNLEYKDLTDAKLNDFVKVYNKARKDAGGTELSEDQIKRAKKAKVGNNGRVVGSEYTLSGVFELAHQMLDDKDKVFGTFEALQTTDGDWISVTQLMGISSDNGFTKDGEVNHFVREKASQSSPAVNYPVHCEVVDDYDFANVWQPPTRNKLQFLAFLHSHPNFFEGVKVRFLGTIAKPIKAKKNAPLGFSEKYIAGDERAIVQKLWQVLD